MKTTTDIAKRYGITRVAVWQAIEKGRLPSTIVPMGRRRFHLINPADAEKLWGTGS